MASLHAVLPSSVAASLAGPRATARGLQYHREGRVELEAANDQRLQAVVRGSIPYRVELWVENDEPAWSCSCPIGEGQVFCKHCVAAALTLDPHVSLVSFVGGGPSDDGVDSELRAAVGHLSRDRLTDLILDQAARDWRLRERLVAEARALDGMDLDMEAWDTRIAEAFAPYAGFVTYREAEQWAAHVDDVIDALADLVELGQADGAIPLLELAHRRADEAIQYVDDSDGWLSGISERLGRLHVEACDHGAPDPVALARRLVDLELTSELDGFHRAAASHAQALGSVGLAEYRRLVEPKWRALGPRIDRWSSERFRLREAMSGVALGCGDPDELVSVRQADMHTSDDYLEIAQLMAAAGRDEEAIEWARRGLDRDQIRPWQTARLRDFLAEQLRGRGESEGAVALYWAAFAARPSVDGYRRFLIEGASVYSAEELKERALGCLRKRVADQRPAANPSTAAPGASQDLIEILLYEGESEEAWEVAAEFGCDRRLWLILARTREESHPLDAIPIYRQEALAEIETKKNRGYRIAVDLLARVEGIARSAGQPELFDRLLVQVATDHKRKRNLMALLAAQGWAIP